MNLQEKRFSTQGGTIRYWVGRAAEGTAAASENAGDAGTAGTDASSTLTAPWLVFLPGLTADHRLFDAQVEHFLGTANVLVWDPPAHGLSRPFSLDFTMDDMAHMLHGILEAEDVQNPVLVGQSMGGYLSQAFMGLYPNEAGGFISVDSAPLKRKYYPDWELAALRHTKGMYQSIPWAILKPWGAKGTAETAHGRTLMLAFMDDYEKRDYVELAAFGYQLLADAVAADRPYDIDCPALLLCGEKDHAGDVKKFNRKWAAGEGLPLVWIPGAGHNSNTDAPDFVNAQIEKFLAENLG